MSKAESSKRLDDSLTPPLELEPPVESMALPLPTALTVLLHPKGLFTVFVAFFASMLLVTSSYSFCPSLMIVKTPPATLNPLVVFV